VEGEKTAQAWALEVQMAAGLALSNGEFERLSAWIRKDGGDGMEGRARSLMLAGRRAVMAAVADPGYRV
jgi:hypothetical protein